MAIRSCGTIYSSALCIRTTGSRILLASGNTGPTDFPWIIPRGAISEIVLYRFCGIFMLY